MNWKLQNISQVRDATPKTIVDVKASIKWVEDTRTVLCGKDTKRERNVRLALIADDTASVKLSVWQELIPKLEDGETYLFYGLVVEDYYGIRVATTTCSRVELCADKLNIQWDKYNIEPKANHTLLP